MYNVKRYIAQCLDSIVNQDTSYTYRIYVVGEEHKIVGVGNIVKYLDEHRDVARYVIEKADIPEYYKDAFETYQESGREEEIRPSIEEDEK